MPYTNTPWSRPQMELLMSLSCTLTDLTDSAEQCALIPDYLSKTLNLEPITLAVVHAATNDTAPVITFIRSSGQIASSEGFNDNILELYNQTRPLGPTEAPMLRHAFNIGDTFSEVTIQNLAGFSRAMVFSRPIDEEYCMMLIIHHRPEEIPSPAVNEILTLLANQLSKLLKCMLGWQDNPDLLGTPFSRLTDREWTVLRALNSDEGEKQLADRLGLSPHTLHSHIKSIYRKVGVQGRLPLLLRLNQARRELRTSTINRRANSAPTEHRNGDRAIAVG